MRGNLTNNELVRHIEYHYPNLRGPLLEMLKRFGNPSYHREWDAPTQVVNPQVELQACPHCGTRYSTDEDQGQ